MVFSSADRAAAYQLTIKRDCNLADVLPAAQEFLRALSKGCRPTPGDQKEGPLQ
jgi:hypothetical protein